MQSIDVTIPNPVLLATFLGTAVLCVVLIIASLLRWHAPRAIYLLVGSAFYLIGALLVTLVFNEPRNEALASGAPDDPDLWADYLAMWTAWNHVRAVAALAAAA